MIRENLASLGIENRALLVTTPAATSLARFKADMVFLDPPYEREAEYASAFEALREHAPALVIAQHSVRFALPKSFNPLHRTRTLKQGDNVLSFYTAAS